MDVPLGTLKPQRRPSLVLGFVNVKTSKKRREGLTCYTTRLNRQSDQSSYDLTSIFIFKVSDLLFQLETMVRPTLIGDTRPKQ